MVEDVSSSTVSTRLDELVEARILVREQYAEIPPRVEYELTETGEELGRYLEPLLKWAEEIDAKELSVGQGKDSVATAESSHSGLQVGPL